MSSNAIRRSGGAYRSPVPAVAQRGAVRFSALDLWAFLLPALSFIEITVVGRLIVTELLMLVMLPWLWSTRDRLLLPRWLVVLWAGWLIGQIFTDLVVSSVVEDFVRGWAAIAFTMTNVAAILVLAATPRRARFFAVGLAAGGILGYLFVPSVYAGSDPWKWAIAGPVGFALAAGLSGRIGARLPWVTVGAFAAFGVMNLVLGFRSLGGVSLLTCGYLAISHVAGGRHGSADRSVIRAGVGLAILAVGMVVTLQLYDAAASEGLLGADAQAKYLEQSGAFGILVGGRSEILVSSQAIIDSPILGHGSWAKDFAYVDLLGDRLSSLGYEMGGGFSDVGLIPAHSYLMGSWVWAGVMGGLFWLAIAGLAIRLLATMYSFRLELAPIVAFSTTLLLWNISFSPYGNSARMTASFGLVLVLLALRSVRDGVADRMVTRPKKGPQRYSQATFGIQGKGSRTAQWTGTLLTQPSRDR